MNHIISIPMQIYNQFLGLDYKENNFGVPITMYRIEEKPTLFGVKIC